MEDFIGLNCNAVRCIKNLNKDDKKHAIEKKEPAPWSIERTCHYLKEGRCPRKMSSK